MDIYKKCDECNDEDRPWCYKCDGTGRILSEFGEELRKFVKEIVEEEIKDFLRNAAR